MLEIRDLTVAYGQHRALEKVSLRVDAGEIVVILGANGAGKSTLLKAVSGICEGKVQGSITLRGHELVGETPDRIVEEGIALVPEGRGIFGDLSVEDNLTLGAYAERARGDEAANLERVYALFPKLVERRRQVARTMSGGEQQMVAIGRAMMSNPALLALDEPSLGLSPLLCKELFQNLGAVRDLGIGILLVEQNARQSLAIADRGYLLENAHIVHEDTAAALREDPAVQAAYLGAGGAAAPHTHDEPMDQRAPLSPEDPPPPAVTLSPVRATTRSADEVLGTSITDLVEKAAARSAPPLPSEETSAADHPRDRLKATIAEIEQAAARARTARTRRVERPMNGSTRPGVEPPPDAEPVKKNPVTIEVYRAPRVEVYRRRPGGDFERE
jgi:branched-chain amino acid transport system ATP-binding protein